jgi:hypothetical protein
MGDMKAKIIRAMIAELIAEHIGRLASGAMGDGKLYTHSDHGACRTYHVVRPETIVAQSARCANDVTDLLTRWTKAAATVQENEDRAFG